MKSWVGVLVVVSVVGARAGAAQAPAAAAWKPFQEIAFLIGTWSGTADSGSRVGGRSARFSAELGGSYVTSRITTIFTAQGGKPDESIEEVGYFVYDRDKRKYVAYYFFSTGVYGVFDVDFPSEGVARLQSTELLNYEAGAKARITFTRKGDGELLAAFEIAPAGRDFVSYVTSKLTKR